MTTLPETVECPACRRHMAPPEPLWGPLGDMTVREAWTVTKTAVTCACVILVLLAFSHAVGFVLTSAGVPSDTNSAALAWFQVAFGVFLLVTREGTKITTKMLGQLTDTVWRLNRAPFGVRLGVVVVLALGWAAFTTSFIAGSVFAAFVIGSLVALEQWAHDRRCARLSS